MRTSAGLVAVALAVGCGSSTPRPAPPLPAAQAPVEAPPAPRLLPGSVGLAMEDVAATDSCAKTNLRITRVADGDDATFVEALTMAPPPPGSAVSLQTWMKNWTAMMRTTVDALGAKVTDDTVAPGARVEALARIIQVREHQARVLNAAPIPPHLGDPKDVDLYCDMMADTATSIDTGTEEFRRKCRDLVVSLKVGDGWWTPVCAGK